jgi:hypothetical protein
MPPITDFRVFVLTPAGRCDPALAIAATRAGAVGVLDAELQPDTARVGEALARLARHARAGFGLRSRPRCRRRPASRG